MSKQWRSASGVRTKSDNFEPTCRVSHTMSPIRSLCAVVLGLALPIASGTTSYAVKRPHDEYVAHSAAARTPTPFPRSGLPTAQAPAIPYAFASKPDFGGGNWRLRRPDGTSLKLPGLTWSAWAAMGEGAVGMAGTEAGTELQQVSGAGAVRSRMVRHFGLAVNPDHAIATTWGAQTCQEQAPEGGGCAVFVNGRRHVSVSTSHGIVTRVEPMLRVSDANRNGRVLGLVSRRTADRRACWGAFRPGGHRVFRTCRYYLDAFSPDGRGVLAERLQTRWWGVRRFAVLGRDGHVVHSWIFDPGGHRSLSQLTWEDSHHLLGVLLAHGRWAVVRIGTDGAVEYAGDPVDAVNEFTPYNLPLR
jgi:hypothetical protein